MKQLKQKLNVISFVSQLRLSFTTEWKSYASSRNLTSSSSQVIITSSIWRGCQKSWKVWVVSFWLILRSTFDMSFIYVSKPTPNGGALPKMWRDSGRPFSSERPQSEKTWKNLNQMQLPWSDFSKQKTHWSPKLSQFLLVIFGQIAGYLLAYQNRVQKQPWE